MRPGGPREPDGAEEFQREAVRPVIVGQLLELAPLRGPGVIDQDVDGAESVQRRSYDLSGRFRETQIERDRDGATLGLLDSGDSFLERIPVACAEDNVRAVARELTGNGAPDASAGASHDGGFCFHSYTIMPAWATESGCCCAIRDSPL